MRIDHCSSSRLWTSRSEASSIAFARTGPNPGIMPFLFGSCIDYQDGRNLIVVIIRRVEGIQLPCLQTLRLALQIIKICLITVAVLLVLSRTRKNPAMYINSCSNGRSLQLDLVVITRVIYSLSNLCLHRLSNISSSGNDFPTTSK